MKGETPLRFKNLLSKLKNSWIMTEKKLKQIDIFVFLEWALDKEEEEEEELELEQDESDKE